MRTIIDVLDIKAHKDEFSVTFGEEREVAETAEEACTEAMRAMPGMEENDIDAPAFISVLKKLGYLIMSEEEYENATDPRSYETRD